MITKLQPNEIFVFGSNVAGFHGAGAARQAFVDFGAEMHVGEGITGQCYAIPTKDENIQTRPLLDIQRSVNLFLDYARKNPDKKFLVTAIGCGLAGLMPSQIAPMFHAHPANVILPEEFKQ